MQRTKVRARANEEYLRENEKILDHHHETFATWARSRSEPDVALLSVLSAHDSLYLPLRQGADSIALQNKRSEEALGQALRWLLHEGRYTGDFNAQVDRDTLTEAGDFLLFAAQYVDIADMHKSYNRGLVQLVVSEGGRTIRFEPTESGSRSELDGIVESMQAGKKHANQKSAKMTGHRVRERLETALAQTQCLVINNRITLTNFTASACEAINNFLEAQYTDEPVPLEEHVQLGGFRAEELRRLYFALRAWSYACLVSYVRTVSPWIPQERCMPTQVVDRKLLANKLCAATGLSSEVVGSILQRLTHEPGSRTDPLLQPLISRGSFLVWSPWFLLGYRQERNVLRVMTQSQELKAIADNAIGERERALTALVEDLLREHGYLCQLHTKIASDKEEGEIDLLAYKPSAPSEVLVVEAKAGLAADEINEVDGATKMVEHGQRQLIRCSRILEAAGEDQQRSWFPFVDWMRVSNVQMLVVPSDSEPNTRFKHDQIPCISLPVFQAQLGVEDYACPSSIVAACKERRWLEGLRVSKSKYERVDIGDISYELPGFEITRSNASRLDLFMRGST